MAKETAFSRLIRQFLAEEGMTAKELADRLNIRESTVHRWLRGDAKPTGTAASILWTLISLSRARSAARTGERTGSLEKTREKLAPHMMGVAGGAALTGLLAGVLPPVGVPLVAVASGLAIYKSMRKWIEKESPQDPVDQVLEEKIQALEEQHMRRARIRKLKEQLEAEEERLQELTGLAEPDDVVEEG
jgi:transcriptional regulator with XRE-family HTH domain